MAFGPLPMALGGIPISTVYVPGLGFVALQGSTVTSTDGSGNQSTPVCLARVAQTVFTQASMALTVNGNSGDLAVSPFGELAVDVNITANTGTSPTIQFFMDRKGADGIYYQIWSSSVVSTATAQVSTTIGAGMAQAQGFGSTARLRWVIGGSGSPGYTFSYSIIGK